MDQYPKLQIESHEFDYLLFRNRKRIVIAPTTSSPNVIETMINSIPGVKSILSKLKVPIAISIKTVIASKPVFSNEPLR